MIKVGWNSVYFQCKIFHSGSTNAFFITHQQEQQEVSTQWWTGAGRVILADNLFLGQMPYGPTDIWKCSCFSPPPPIAFSFLALKCYIHFPKEATGKWTVTNTVYFWNEPPQVLENGLGLEESLIFLKDLVSSEQRSRKHDGCYK